MLFDEKDLSVFDNPDSRSYFKEKRANSAKCKLNLHFARFALFTF